LFISNYKKMKNRIIHGVAGTLVLISLLMVTFTAELNWLWLAAFVGANLLQSAFTKWCLMDTILDSAGVKD
jgi:hypothetical protein